MLEFSEMQLQGLAVHRAGNKSKDEGTTITDRLYSTDPKLEKVLMRYFLKPFKADDFYQLFAEDGPEHNPVFDIASRIFEQPDLLLEQSGKLVQHLYNQSEHPHIKPGEVFVGHFRECVLEGELVDVLGIFKSEIKDTFLLTGDDPDRVTMSIHKGINTKKLDKGCLIFNTEKEKGFRVLSVDQNNYDAQYWMDDFLGLKIEENDIFQTKSYINMVQDFAKEVVAPEEDKQEELYVVNKSMEYFDQNETFDAETFEEQVFDAPNLEPEAKTKIKEKFQEYKENYQDSFGFQFDDDFEISEPAVKTMAKKVKTAINLDTNIQIKMDFNDAESSHKFLEKGFDEEKEMYYYKVYFNHEKT